MELKFQMLKNTGKSLSEALIFASTNPQYEYRLFIELQVQYMKISSIDLGRTCCVQKLFLTFRIFLYTTCSPHVLQKRRASDKDLPVFYQKFKVAEERKNFVVLRHLKFETKRPTVLNSLFH